MTAPALATLARLAADRQQALDRLQDVAAALRPTLSATLPAVSATLHEIVRAAEHAALRVLDEAEALQADAEVLQRALRLAAAMEFQDLTAQQVAHARAALEDVRARLRAAAVADAVVEEARRRRQERR